MFEVGRTAHIRLRDGQYIYAATTQSASYRAAYMLIGIEPDQLSHARNQAATNANLDGMRARRASAKRSLSRIDRSISS